MDETAQEGCEDAVEEVAAPERLYGMVDADKAVGGEMSGAAAAYDANGRPVKNVAFRGHAWLLRGVWGCCLRMRPPGGDGVSGGCHSETRPYDGRGGGRLRGRDCVMAVGDVVHAKNCSLLACQQGRRTLPQPFLCVFCVLFSILSKGFLGHHQIGARFCQTSKRGSSARQTSKT